MTNLHMPIMSTNKMYIIIYCALYIEKKSMFLKCLPSQLCKNINTMLMRIQTILVLCINSIGICLVTKYTYSDIIFSH